MWLAHTEDPLALIGLRHLTTPPDGKREPPYLEEW
jgi:hypothetical protein